MGLFRSPRCARDDEKRIGRVWRGFLVGFEWVCFATVRSARAQLRAIAKTGNHGEFSGMVDPRQRAAIAATSWPILRQPVFATPHIIIIFATSSAMRKAVRQTINPAHEAAADDQLFEGNCEKMICKPAISLIWALRKS
jgi:hypothetical protein